MLSVLMEVKLSVSHPSVLVVLPKDGVIEWTDRVSKEEETDGEVNGSPLFLSASISRCTVALTRCLAANLGQKSKEKGTFDVAVIR